MSVKIVYSKIVRKTTLFWVNKLKRLHKVHYTTETMLKLVITYIKLPEGRFPITMYRPFYLMVWTWRIRQTNSEQISNWFDPISPEYIYLVTYKYKVEFNSNPGNTLNFMALATQNTGVSFYTRWIWKRWWLINNCIDPS